MTVGLFSPGWPPSRFANGIVTYVEAVAEGMLRLGHRPVVLAGQVVEEGSAEGARMPVIDLQPLGEPTVGARLFDRVASRVRPSMTPIGIRRLARGIVRATRDAGGTGRLDVLELEESFGLPGMVAGRVSVPVVARLHGPWFLNGPNQGGDPSSAAFAQRVRIERDALTVVDGITAPSVDVIERTRAYYDLPIREAEAIPNPVLGVPPDRRWRAEGAEQDHVLFVGRFDRHKGGDTIIDAFALLLRDRPGARLTFVGPDKGLDRNGRRWSLPEFAEDRLPGALADGRIRWLGTRPPSEIEELRRRASVTVVASRYETFAITITEAMAAGSPLVATRAGGAAELFEDGEHGLYVDPEDPEGMALAVSKLLADPARAAELGRAASASCDRRYSPEAVASTTIRYYRQMMNRLIRVPRTSEALP